MIDQKIITVALVAAVAALLIERMCSKRAAYSSLEAQAESDEIVGRSVRRPSAQAPVGEGDVQVAGDASDAVALSSALLPREISEQEDYSAFSPDELLKNQSFLDPSASIGINTVSGSLRNANQQVRAEPPNPRGAVPFPLSTIEQQYGAQPAGCN